MSASMRGSHATRMWRRSIEPSESLSSIATQRRPSGCVSVVRVVPEIPVSLCSSIPRVIVARRLILTRDTDGGSAMTTMRRLNPTTSPSTRPTPSMDIRAQPRPARAGARQPLWVGGSQSVCTARDFGLCRLGPKDGSRIHPFGPARVLRRVPVGHNLRATLDATGVGTRGSGGYSLRSTVTTRP